MTTSEVLIKYTQEDMKTLSRCSSNELAELIRGLDYDPNRFEEMMQGLPKDHKILFNTSLEDLLEVVANPRLKGYVTFRLGIGK